MKKEQDYLKEILKFNGRIAVNEYEQSLLKEYPNKKHVEPIYGCSYYIVYLNEEEMLKDEKVNILKNKIKELEKTIKDIKDEFRIN